MELNTDVSIEGLTKDQIEKLKKYGRADEELFRICWKEFLPSEGLTTISIAHLILIFQAYCLIYPIQPVTKGDDSGIITREFIIPSKLPDHEFEVKSKDISERMKSSTKFFFNFYQFLPDEIYHRLTCLFSSEATPQEHLDHCYSKHQCFFSGLFGTDWIINMEEDTQRLCILVQ